MIETQNKLMHNLAAKTRAGYSFDQEFYCSDAVFKADMDHVISQKWILAGHVSRVPNKGDYFLFKIGGEQIIHRSLSPGNITITGATSMIV